VSEISLKWYTYRPTITAIRKCRFLYSSYFGYAAKRVLSMVFGIIDASNENEKISHAI